jgi:glutamate dehydrogenase/leucine dehydrogenase
MVKAGLEVISCGANVPFADSEIFVGPIGVWVDEQISLIPDFIANCGMARVFAYLMSDKVEITDQAIFSDVSQTIKTALERTFSKNPGKTKLAQTSYEIALKQLM